jgi:hypothetical protein
MLKTSYECNQCNFKKSINTPIGEAPFMVIFHSVKEIIIKIVFGLHCRLTHHTYTVWNKWA